MILHRIWAPHYYQQVSKVFFVTTLVAVVNNDYIEDQPSFLAVVIESHPEAWSLLKDNISFKEAIQALLVFINGHIALNNTNRVCVIASHNKGATFLYPQAGKLSESKGSSTDAKFAVAHAQSMYRQFRNVDESVYRVIGELLGKTPEVETQKKERNASLSGALSLALAYINKVCSLSNDVRMKSRILVISVTDDMASQYIPTMNCIFAAQKQVSIQTNFRKTC